VDNLPQETMEGTVRLTNQLQQTLNNPDHSNMAQAVEEYTTWQQSMLSQALAVGGGTTVESPAIESKYGEIPESLRTTVKEIIRQEIESLKKEMQL
jgi:hypothetical protein